MTLAILGGVGCAVGALLLLRQAVAAPDAAVGRYFWPIVGCLSATVLLMATGRHFYREERLRPHRLQVERATLDFQETSREARQNRN